MITERYDALGSEVVYENNGIRGREASTLSCSEMVVDMEDFSGATVLPIEGEIGKLGARS